MKRERRDIPFSVDDFLEKLEANDPEVALDPLVQAGLERLSAAVRRHDHVLPRLLLIDDDDNDTVLFEDALRMNGVVMAVTRVRDGMEAMDYFEGKDTFADRSRFPLPHLTILDLKLPKLTGLEVLKRMRKLPQCATLAVIVLTSSRTRADRDEASRLNVSAYLAKPDSLAALVELVQRVKTSWLDANSSLHRGGAERENI